MTAVLTAAQARQVDREAVLVHGIPSLSLMEAAGTGATAVATKMLEAAGAGIGAVVAVAGPGQNGGDALVVARHLHVTGAPVRVLATTEDPPGDAGVQMRIVRSLGIPVQVVPAVGAADVSAGALAHAALVVDGLFGTGLARSLEGRFAALVRAVNTAARPVLALDLPSGLHCDSGRPLGIAVRATTTATFAARKAGFDRPAAAAYVGTVVVVPIGAPLPG